MGDPGNSADETEVPTLSAGTKLGKYSIVRLLGAGGMGAVYEIEHELTKHRRALKMLHAAMANIPGVVERFLREASAAGRVGNPHIVETFDAGTLEGGEPYIVMEMLKGCPLTDKIGQGPMSVSEVVDLIGQACDGVQAAHDAGIVHRDLKPDNLFVTEQDGRPFVKILDFGISKFDPGKTGGMALTQEGAALGTPYYMSPEQIRGETSLDARADVYALGVILYECFAAQRPFDADSLTHLAVLIHTGQAKPLLEHRPDLPPGITEVVSRAMATDRNNRIQSAQDLKTELAKFGAIAFRSTQAAMPPAEPVLPTPPMSAMGAPGLATSAAGVSVAQARSQVTQATQKGQKNVILAGFAALAVVGVVGAVLVRGGGQPAPDASSSLPATKPVDPPRAASPAPPPQPAPEPIATAPAPSASAPAATPPSIPPPRSATPAAPSPAAAKAPAASPAQPAPAAQPGAAKPAADGTKRTEQKGLVKENPFK
jgi:hypothetical protein